MTLIILAIVAIIVSVANVVMALIEYNLSGASGWFIATIFMVLSLIKEIRDYKTKKNKPPSTPPPFFLVLGDKK